MGNNHKSQSDPSEIVVFSIINPLVCLGLGLGLGLGLVMRGCGNLTVKSLYPQNPLTTIVIISQIKAQRLNKVVRYLALFEKLS